MCSNLTRRDSKLPILLGKTLLSQILSGESWGWPRHMPQTSPLVKLTHTYYLLENSQTYSAAISDQPTFKKFLGAAAFIPPALLWKYTIIYTHICTHTPIFIYIHIYNFFKKQWLSPERVSRRFLNSMWLAKGTINKDKSWVPSRLCFTSNYLCHLRQTSLEPSFHHHEIRGVRLSVFINSSTTAFWMAQFMVQDSPVHHRRSASMANVIKFQYFRPVTDYQNPAHFQSHLGSTLPLVKNQYG